jgi:hypothetical protein
MGDLKATIRVPADLLAVLDARRGSAKRITALQQIVVQALSAPAAGSKPKQMTKADIRRKLEVRARGGSSPALRQLRDLLEDDRVEAEIEAWRAAEQAYEAGELTEAEIERLARS